MQEFIRKEPRPEPRGRGKTGTDQRTRFVQAITEANGAWVMFNHEFKSTVPNWVWELKKANADLEITTRKGEETCERYVFGRLVKPRRVRK